MRPWFLLYKDVENFRHNGGVAIEDDVNGSTMRIMSAKLYSTQVGNLKLHGKSPSWLG